MAALKPVHGSAPGGPRRLHKCPVTEATAR
jgi:hypothetical protein